jgi:phage tail sheath protein FI
MPVYQAPGVYVEEIPGTPPIAGVGTSTAAFVGQIKLTDLQMPAKPDGSQNPDGTPKRLDPPEPEKAYLVTSFDQFKRRFGDFQAANQTLAHSVFAFFLNGGTRCHVVGVDDVADVNKIQAALKETEKIDEVAIVAVPGALGKDVQEEVISNCENVGDRFAIIDGQRTTTISVGAIQGGTRDSDYAALYFPWISVPDRTLLPEDPGNPGQIEDWKPKPGQTLFLPPAAAMAGIYARVDASRGVHKAPANETVRGALGLEYLVTHREQMGLNPDGINVIRGFDGNFLVWGARTLGGDGNGEFKYINVRRLFLFLRESLDEGTQFAVFEPNSPPLWQKMRRAITAFLTNVWRDGALFGNTPDEAFYVKCDETTNPPEVRALGQCITEIGVAVVNPAEFVIIRISQVTQATE